MKNKPHYISFNVGNYRRDTPHMGPESWQHHGIYWALRLIAWETPLCRLPTDALWIAREMGCSLELFNKTVLPVLERQFKKKGGYWVDRELSTYQQRAEKFSLLQSRRAKGLKNKGSDGDSGHASNLLSSKKEQHHRKPAIAVGKKKTKRWASSHLFEK